MANKDVKKEVKKAPKTETPSKASSPPSKGEKKEGKESKKWYALPPTKDKCSCRSEFQDRRYGLGIRLHTRRKDGKNCTVCGSQKL